MPKNPSLMSTPNYWNCVFLKPLILEFVLIDSPLTRWRINCILGPRFFTIRIAKYGQSLTLLPFPEKSWVGEFYAPDCIKNLTQNLKFDHLDIFQLLRMLAEQHGLNPCTRSGTLNNFPNYKSVLNFHNIWMDHPYLIIQKKMSFFAQNFTPKNVKMQEKSISVDPYIHGIYFKYLWAVWREKKYNGGLSVFGQLKNPTELPQNGLKFVYCSLINDQKTYLKKLTNRSHYWFGNMDAVF